MKNTLIIKTTVILLLFFSAAQVFSNNTGGHRGSVTGIFHRGNAVYSSAEDGFLVTWDANQRTSVDRFQLTTYKIQSMVVHPVNNEICIIESGDSYYKISVWNYAEKRRLFSVFSSSPVTYINYSAGGSYIIAANFNGETLVLLDSVTGNIYSTPAIPRGSVSFAVTGRAERNMLIYQAEHENYDNRSALAGKILYLDLVSLSVTGSFEAPGFMSGIIAFGNNRFLAGISAEGLLLVDAASGDLLDSRSDTARDILLNPDNDGFFVLEQRGNQASIYRYGVDRDAKLLQRRHEQIQLSQTGRVSVFLNSDSFYFGSVEGGIFRLGQQNRVMPFTFNYQLRIKDIAAGESHIAVINENGELFHLPLDYRNINNSTSLSFLNKNSYNRISSFSFLGQDYFILWQAANVNPAPQLVDSLSNEINLDILSGRFPLRAIAASSNRLLTLDSRGSLTVRNLDVILNSSPAAGTDYNFSFTGAINAVFINNDNIALSCSVISNNSPFISLNIRTGETISYFHPVQAGLSVYPGVSGLFAAAAERTTGGMNTLFINLNNSSRIFVYHSEAHFYSLAQSSGNIAISCDSEGAFITSSTPFERTSGLPVRILGNDDFFISLDSEGSITWHDNTTGAVLAAFSHYGNRWIFTSGGRSIEKNRR
ncbi:MAG: hypothetical protein FWB83_03985 [Treponema sp.]|nr:hypothetical protein [Treponema sp.]